MSLIDYWSFILFLICINGIRRILLWSGSGFRKFIYIILLIFLSSTITFFLALKMGYVSVGQYPLLNIFLFSIIFHLYLTRPSQIWVHNGLLPFSKDYPAEEKKDWKDMLHHERVFLIGTILVTFSIDIPISDNSLLMFFRMVLFWIGIFTIVAGLYLRYSSPKLLAGFISLILGLWIMAINQMYGILLFWFGVGLLIWGYKQIKKSRSEIQIETSE